MATTLALWLPTRATRGTTWGEGAEGGHVASMDTGLELSHSVKVIYIVCPNVGYLCPVT